MTRGLGANGDVRDPLDREAGVLRDLFVDALDGAMAAVPMALVSVARVHQVEPTFVQARSVAAQTSLGVAHLHEPVQADAQLHANSDLKLRVSEVTGHQLPGDWVAMTLLEIPDRESWRDGTGG